LTTVGLLFFKTHPQAFIDRKQDGTTKNLSLVNLQSDFIPTKRASIAGRLGNFV